MKCGMQMTEEEVFKFQDEKINHSLLIKLKTTSTGNMIYLLSLKPPIFNFLYNFVFQLIILYYISATYSSLLRKKSDCIYIVPLRCISS